MKLKTWWQGLKYWLKGGIISLVIFLLMDFVFVLFLKLNGGSAASEAESFFGLYAYPLTFFGILIQYGPFIFVAGALIGLIIGKIKKK